MTKREASELNPRWHPQKEFVPMISKPALKRQDRSHARRNGTNPRGTTDGDEGASQSQNQTQQNANRKTVTVNVSSQNPKDSQMDPVHPYSLGGLTWPRIVRRSRRGGEAPRRTLQRS